MENTKRVKITVTGYYTVSMDEAELDYGTTDPTEMLKIDQENANTYLPEEILAWSDKAPTVELSWDDEYPDKNCYTLPDGECVSTQECMHTVK